MNASSAGALLRIGRRNVARSRWRSLLVIGLVLLPVAGMVAAGTIMKTVTPTPERAATERMGVADLLVNPGVGGSPQLLQRRLPEGSVIEPMLQTGATLVVPGLHVSMTLDALDPNGLAAGMLALVAGRFPTTASEVAITAELARLAGTSVGGRVELAERGSLEVVGIVEDGLRLQARTALLEPSAALEGVATKEASWLIRLPPETDPQSLGLGVPAEGSGGAAPGSDDGSAPAFVFTARNDVLFGASEAGPGLVVLGGLALVDAALVAAAAFAVGVRRRQRELGLMAATGAEPRHVLGSVLAESLVLGALGAAAGTVLGLVAAFAASPFLDNLTAQRNPAVSIDLPYLVVAACMGTAAAVISAIAPAWGASRLPVLAALAGRRPAAGSAARSLVLGLVVVGLGIAATMAGAAVRLAGESGTLSLALLLGGAVLGTLGFGACSPWLLARLERPAVRLPLAPRIALRDTARARSRNGPIVTALLAAFAATVAIAAYQSSLAASYAARWQPALLPDQLLVQGPGSSEGGAAAALELHAVAAAPIPGAGDETTSVWISPAGSNDPNAALSIQNVTTGDAELLRALGADAAIEDFEAGSIVLLVDKPVDVRQVTLHVIGSDGAELAKATVPARLVVTAAAGDLPGAVLPPSVVTRFAIAPGKSDWRFVMRLPHAVGDSDVATAGKLVADYPDTWLEEPRPPEIAGGAFRIALIVASLVFALTVTAVAVALGEAESRPEQRTLLAIGADPALRRRITAARAGVIALVGGLLAVPAGLLPVWGLLLSRGSPLVVPVPEVAGAVLLLPVLAILGAWLLSRPIPEWAAFRDLPAT